MALDHIQPEGHSRPTGYTHVVKATGTLVFLAGQVSLDGGGNIVGEGDFEAQARQVFANVRNALAAVGAGPEHIAKTTTYLVGVTPEHRSALTTVRSEFLPDPPPASTLIGVQALARPEFLLEVEAIAVID